MNFNDFILQRNMIFDDCPDPFHYQFLHFFVLMSFGIDVGYILEPLWYQISCFGVIVFLMVFESILIVFFRFVIEKGPNKVAKRFQQMIPNIFPCIDFGLRFDAFFITFGTHFDAFLMTFDTLVGNFSVQRSREAEKKNSEAEKQRSRIAKQRSRIAKQRSRETEKQRSRDAEYRSR